MKPELLDRFAKNTRTKATIINVIMVVFASFFTIFYSNYIFIADGTNLSVAGFVYALRYVPIMLTAALGGSVPGLISVLIVFFYRSVVEAGFSYLTFIYLLTVIVVDLITRRKWFDKLYKSLIVCLFLQNLVGSFWGIVILLLSDQGLHALTLRQVVLFFFNELPGCLFTSLIIYYIFKSLSDDKKRLFSNGKYYMDPKNLSEDEVYEVEGRSRLGHVVMNIIIVEALFLGLSAEFASNTLVQTIKDYSYISEDNAGNYDYSSIKSVERLERSVSRDLSNEFKYETVYFTDSLTGKRGINYRFSVRLAMLISIIVIPLAVFMNRYAQRRIAEPIRMLSKAVARFYSDNEASLGENVEFIHNLDIRTGDEIEELYHAVDKTGYRLIEHLELLESRQKIEDQLKVARSANEAKSRFLSNISHEIRTPINAVLGFDEMILRQSHDKEILGYARDIQSSGKTLLALINDVLDFSKIEAGKMEIVPVEYELGSLMNDIVNMSQIRASEKNLQLVVNVDEQIPHVLFGDEIRIKQCIINIITNAVKYTEIGSVTLDVGYEVVPPENPETDTEEFIDMKIQISDTGIGIRPEDMDKLTSAFERIDERKNRTIEGTGLGISIVMSLLDMMDSKLSVDSEYGRGSVFSFVIRQKVVDWDPVGDFSAKVRESRDEMAGYRESFHARDARILVVDDTRTNLTVIQGLLRQTLMQIDTATSGMDALGLVKENKYNIIFLDHRMPEMDGIQTFHAMKEMRGNLNPDTPVIALTANAISGSREMYVREGFSNYMSKPVDPAKLEEMIISYLPKDIMSFPGEPEFEPDGGDNNEEEKKAYKELLRISGIDVKAAIARCGSALVAREVMKDFREGIDERAGLIERYEYEKDIRNYTIYVHGLKSAARAVGALDLAEKAEHLEQCGNGGDIEEIEMLTPQLLELYRSYKNRFEPLFGEDDSDKPEISVDELENAFASMKEFVSASYFDSADDIMKMLEDYRIPDKYRPKYNNVKRLLSAVDRDGLLNVL